MRLRALIAPVLVLLAAGGMYGKSLYDEYRYDLEPVRVRAELRKGTAASAKFRVDLDATYLLGVEVTRNLPYVDTVCTLGTNARSERCAGTPMLLDVRWSVRSDGVEVARGTTGEDRGVGWSFNLTRFFGRFDAKAGKPYELEVVSEKDATAALGGETLDYVVLLSPVEFRRLEPEAFKAYMSVPGIQFWTKIFAVVGLLWGLAVLFHGASRAPGGIPVGADGGLLAFTAPALNRTDAWVGLVLFGVSAAGLVYVGFLSPRTQDSAGAALKAIGVLAALFALGAWRWSRLRGSVLVTDTDIERQRPGAPAVRLAWADVAELRERLLLRRLELRGREGRELHVEYGFGGYAELRQLIAKHTGHARRRRWL